MALSIDRIEGRAGIAQFVDLPHLLYSPEDLWVPALRSQEIKLLTPGKHPFWETASRELFIARNGDRNVGRIAAIIDYKYNDYAGEKCGAFGFFECENNQKTANALLEAARDWLVGQGMRFMRGPLNPSTNYTCGMLVSGFELAPSIMMPWNHLYYPHLAEKWGLHKEEDLFAYTIDRSSQEIAPTLLRELEILRDKGTFVCRSSSSSTLAGDIRIMLEIYGQSWARNWGFSPLSPREADELVAELKSALDPELFVLFFHKDKPAAGMVALPDMNPLLKRLNGSLGIMGPWHFWRSRKDVRRGLRIMLFGILPEYRLYGLPLLLLDHMLHIAKARPGLEWVEGSWVLEDNAAIDDLIEDFGGRITRRYRIYRRDIGAC